MTEPTQELAARRRPGIELGVLVALVTAFVAVSLLVHRPLTKGVDHARALGVIVAAGLTLIMYSFLYRDNPLFRAAEHLFVGVALGYQAVLTWEQYLRPLVYEPFFRAPTGGALWHEVQHRGLAVVLGLLLLTRLSRKYGWLSRYAYALLVGWGAGVGIPRVTNSYILEQLYSAVAPFQEAISGNARVLSWPWLAGVAFPLFGAVVVMVGTVAVLWYFFFSVEHKRAGRSFARLGILFLMISFGASFGYTVMGRVSLLIGRVQFLLLEWLKIPK